MSFDAKIIAEATRKRKAHTAVALAEGERLKEEAYRRCPHLLELDQQIRFTMRDIMAVAMKQTTNQNIEEIRAKNRQFQEERTKLLEDMGFLPSSLNDQISCDSCQDQLWIGTDMCSCLKDFCIQEQLRSLTSLLQGERQSFQNFRLDLYSDDIWPQTSSSPKDTMSLMYQNCHAYAMNFLTFPMRNLLLIGSTGIGKTFLSACIAREVTLQGFSVVYGTMNTIIEAFEIRQFRKRNDEDYEYAQETTKSYLTADLLILDDLGTETKTFILDTAFYELINSRNLAGLHTVISTNLSEGEMKLRYPPQIYSRLMGEYHVLNMLGNDLRPAILHLRQTGQL